jgi:alpha-glucosidase
MAEQDLFERVRFRGQPQAHPDATVVSGNARFTVLTPRLIRMEWSETGEFEDRATYAFPTRYAPAAPDFEAREEDGTLVLDTGKLVLRYEVGSGRFTSENLAITFELEGEVRTWRPGTPNPGNLRGTRRTLDNCSGEAALDEGLLSRDGWSLFDDSASVLFDEEGWVAPRPDHELQDWYFFAYEHDYKEALADYLRFGGPAPLVPRYILGAWWSRYWEYSAEDLRELVGEFEEHDVPLDVLVIDIDWHTQEGWTGYTWNRELFPDPPAFLGWVHSKGLRTTLNLHPAEGVQPHEEIYPEFAEAMGADPESGEGVPFRIGDKRFVKHYFEMLHHPREEEGVDFWWVDWQQGEVSDVKGLDPLPWLNHLHFLDITRHGVRPMLYSRWGGLGNHRYYIGFSGDTFATWEALQFQPYFTATAANVGYGWWSHDIGGHMGGATPPELYTRWVQYGALSPILRLHATKDPLAERRPWKYPREAYVASRQAFRLRYRLIPYIYTMARVNADTGLSLCRPTYYEHPEEEGAYTARYQYYFGDQMIAAPIVHPADEETGLARADVWLPRGTWIDWQTKETFTGPRWVRLVGDLTRIPMLVKAGGILPMRPGFREMPEGHLASGTTAALPRDELVLALFPGADGVFRLYEDDGVTADYAEGEYEWTEIRTHHADTTSWAVAVGPVEGRCEALPRARAYEVRFVGSRRPDEILVDGEPAANWSYDSEELTTIVRVPERDKSLATTVTARAEEGIVALGAERDRAVATADVQRLLGEAAPEDPGDVEAVLQVDAGGRADAVARLGGPFASVLEYVTPEEAARRLGRVVLSAPADGNPYDAEVVFTLYRDGEVSRHAVRVADSTVDRILDTPFAFEGEINAARWEVEVELHWLGETMRTHHASEPLFPAVPVWTGLVYDEGERDLGWDDVLVGGALNRELEWESYAQSCDEIVNVNEPHVIHFWHEHRKALDEEQPLAAYLAVKVVSDEAREAVLRFGAPADVEVYLNGERLEEVPVEEGGPALMRNLRRSESFRLRKGENLLVVRTAPGGENYLFWYFGAGLVTPEGDLLTAARYE